MRAARGQTHDAFRAISDLMENLTSGRDLSPESRELLLDGLRTCVASDFELELFKAIGLKSRGGVSLDQQRRLDRRDALIVRLWHTCEQFAGQRPVAAAKLMQLSSQRYQANRWVRERAGSGPDVEPDMTWWLILSEGAGLPKSKRLQQILESAKSAASN